MKKGFTLVELLGVIILLGMLLAFTYPKILNIAEKKEAEIDQAKIKLINNAALQYINENPVEGEDIGDTRCISLEDLDNSNLIPVEIDDIKDKYESINVKIGKNNKNSYTLSKDKCQDD